MFRDKCIKQKKNANSLHQLASHIAESTKKKEAFFILFLIQLLNLYFLIIEFGKIGFELGYKIRKKKGFKVFGDNFASSYAKYLQVSQATHKKQSKSEVTMTQVTNFLPKFIIK